MNICPLCENLSLEILQNPPLLLVVNYMAERCGLLFKQIYM